MASLLCTGKGGTSPPASGKLAWAAQRPSQVSNPHTHQSAQQGRGGEVNCALSSPGAAIHKHVVPPHVQVTFSSCLVFPGRPQKGNSSLPDTWPPLPEGEKPSPSHFKAKTDKAGGPLPPKALSSEQQGLWAPHPQEALPHAACCFQGPP